MGALALSLALTLSGCGNSLARLHKGAELQGQARARVNLPAYPAECRRHEPHAPLVEGADATSALKRERAALGRAWARTDRCAGFYDDLRGKLK